jgi:transposase-like protein
MVAARFEDGVVKCSHCGSSAVTYLAKARVYKCYAKHPRAKFSLKVGTIMEDSPLGLDKWLTTIWMIANCKNGISSYEVHRAIGVTQKSAWFMLHRIRLAMQNGSLEKLSVTVEMDETYIGGKAGNMHKSKLKKAAWERNRLSVLDKVAVFGILERGGRVRTAVVKDTKRVTLDPHIQKNVERGSNVYTDSHPAYSHLNDRNAFTHEFINHVDEYVRGNVHTNGIENFWSLLKRTIRGTYVAVEPFHLFRYLDEQSFRFNTRRGKDADRFFEVLSSITGKRLEYKELIGKPSC